jgi:white-opaque regulator 2
MNIEQIIDSLGLIPPDDNVQPTAETLNEIIRVYHEVYAPGLAAFFETKWYHFQAEGANTFPNNPLLKKQFAIFLKILETTQPNDVSRMSLSGILETRIVWHLACLAEQTPGQMNAGLSKLPPDGDAIEAQNRLYVIRTLLEGRFLSTNPLAAPVSDLNEHRVREFEFWFHLAEFARSKDYARRKDVLSKIRNLLDGRENRDLLYSIAVARQLAPQFREGSQPALPAHLNEEDPKHALAVASGFIRREADVSGGTTNVVRRFSEIAIRALISPGHNIGRQA